MNDLMAEFFPSDEQVESRAVAHAFGLLAAVGDAKNAKVRLQQITDATAEYAEQRAAAEKAVADAEVKSAAAEAADADVAKRTEAFQTWVDGTEKSYREREERIRVNEETGAKREAKLAELEAELARRVASHNSQLRALRANLGEAAA